MHNVSPSFQLVIILSLHNLTLFLSLTRVRGELWHLLLFVNRSWRKHRSRKVGFARTRIDPAVSRLAAEIDERCRNNSFPGTTTRTILCVSIYLLLPVSPHLRELGNSLSFHCGQPLSLGGVCLWVCSTMISLRHSSINHRWLRSAI